MTSHISRESQGSQSDRSQSSSYDAAALAAAALAGALAVFIQPGPYRPFSAVIGLTLLFVIIAFERGRERDTFQNIAFGAVTGFVSLLVAGLILELVAGGGDLDGVCLKRFEPCEPNEFASSVPEWWLLISWFVISCGFALTDLFFFQKKFPRHFLDKISNMVTVTVDEIQEDLAGYLCRVEAGETVVIVRADKPFAEIKPVGSDSRAPRPAGLCTGEFVVPDDFDKPLPEDVLRQFEGK